MDVTCERCGTEYEFDETLLSEGGTRVKCTNCGHLFRVFKSTGTKSWHVRLKDGTEAKLDSLRDLQRRIAEGTLSPEDLISRTGEGWKRLGDIVELQSFFAAAQSALQGRSAPPNSARAMSLRPQQAAPPREKPAETAKNPNAPTPFARTPSYRPDETAKYQNPFKGNPMGSNPTAGSSQADTRSGETTVDGPKPNDLMTTGSAPHNLRDPDEATPARTPLPRGGIAPPMDLEPPSSGSATLPERQLVYGSLPLPPPPTLPTNIGPALPSLPSRSIPATAEYPRDQNANSAASAAAIAARSSRRPSPPSVRPPATGSQPSAAQNSSMRPQARGPTAPVTAGRPLRLNEEEFAAAPAAKSRTWLWVLIAVLVLGGAGGWGAYAFTIGKPVTPQAGPTAQTFVASGDQAFARDNNDDYETSIQEYTKAQALAPQDTQLIELLARAHAAWATGLSFDADDDAKASEHLRREARKHAEVAAQLASTALTRNPQSASAKLAHAEAEIVLSHMDAAMALTCSETPVSGSAVTDGTEACRLAALARLGTASAAALNGAEPATLAASLEKALELAQRAARSAQTDARSRYATARALALLGKKEEAQVELAAVLSSVPTHVRAARLRTALETGAFRLATSEPLTASARDAGTTVAPQVATGEALPRGYEALVTRAEQLLARGDRERARAMYEAAQQERPGSSEALTGLGKIEMDARNYREAAAFLRAPADNGFSPALFLYARCMDALNRPIDALAYYERFLARSGPAADMAFARQRAELIKEDQAPSVTAPPTEAPNPPEAPTESPRQDPTPPPESPPSSGEAPQ